MTSELDAQGESNQSASSTSSAQSKIDSPCIRRCTLDDRDICVGCFRSLNEILAWNKSTDAQKAQILELAKRRAKA